MGGFDPFWDVRNRVLWDNELGVIVEHTQWFPGLLDAVRHLHNTGQRGDPELRVLAHVPGVIIEDWCNKQKISFDEFTRSSDVRRRFLNDPDLSLFRVDRGRV